MSGSALDRFAATLNFGLDEFQRVACTALENGHGVLVCAPTGAGKTIVGEFAVSLALENGTKCFYTTPIKALSNQKYHDLVARHGADQVGLLTGDSSINSNAPIVVMTTEVLRNMIYANSPALQGLSHVVMDEVHFLADRFRGAVWEEVILHLYPEVRLVSLSATVSNAEEFGAWMQTIRGDTTVVVDDHRPVPLYTQVLAGTRLLPLFRNSGVNGGREVNGELTAYLKSRQFGSHAAQRYGRRAVLSRPEIIGLLDRDGLLPAISFIFSRAGCDGAFTQCLRSGLNVLPPQDVDRVREIAERHVAELSSTDRDVLGVDRWIAGLSRGFAAHHAGMLPAFRQAVEELFAAGLVRAVFATETLALGINMPARSVVLERLVKYNGEAHVDLTPGEFTQLTGRAGRRGIDVEGHAVIVWSPELVLDQVVGLAGARTFPLRSSFVPEYNMAVNLVGRLGLSGSREILQRSFAQYQADKAVVDLAHKERKAQRRLTQLNEELVAAARDADIPLRVDADAYGGIIGYQKLRTDIRSKENSVKKDRRTDRQAAVTERLFALRPGEVVALHGRHRGVAVVLEKANDAADPRPLVVSEDAWAGRVQPREFLYAPEVLGTVRLKKNIDRRTGRGRRDIAATLRNSGIEAPKGRYSARGEDLDSGPDPEVTALRAVMRAHPAHALWERSNFGPLARQWERADEELRRAQRAISERTSTLATGFNRIVELLAEMGYLTAGPEPTLTDSGRVLSRIYNESDLLICQCLRAGIWHGLDAAELAAVVSTMVYETRGDAYSDPELITGNAAVRGALGQTLQQWRELTATERRHRVSPTREPDSGFALAALTWARGAGLAEALAVAGDRGKPLPPGDFVRNTRQVIDLLEQLRQVADDPAIAAVAARSVAALRRGVVAADG